jgi:hypothetical protein
MNFGYEKQPLGDYEMTDSDGPDCEEAPSDDDVVIVGAATSTNGLPNAIRRSQCRRRNVVFIKMRQFHSLIF